MSQFVLPAFRTFRTDRRTLTLALALCGMMLAGLSFLPRAPVLVWNLSPSIAPGLYRIERTAPAAGDIAAVRPQGALRDGLREAGALADTRLLLKPVIAVSGATACRTGLTVTVDGRPVAAAKARRREGLALPSWSGCRRLAHDELFLVSAHPASFDSRYFGPVSTADVVGVVRPLVVFPHEGAAP